MSIAKKLAASVVASICFAGSAHALTGPTPSNGTMDGSTPTNAQGERQLAFEGGPFGGANVTPQLVGLAGVPPLCATGEIECEVYTLTIGANPEKVLIEVSWSDSVSDFDIYLIDGDGNIVASAASEANPERMTETLDPGTYELQIIPFAAAVETYNGTITAQAIVEPPPPLEQLNAFCTQQDIEMANTASMDAGVVKALSQLGPDALYGSFVHFSAGSREMQDAVLAEHGFQLKHDFRKYAPVVFAEGPAIAYRALANSALVRHFQYNAPLRYFGDTQSWSSRVREVQEQVGAGPYRDAGGNILLGQGVTLGVIDGGLLGAHPDFADNLKHNFKLVNIEDDENPYIDVGTTNSENPAGGHGTHVTGTVGGAGAMSDGGYPDAATAPNVPGTYTGVAPKADLMHWGHGAVIFVLDASIAYRHILDNRAAALADPNDETLAAFRELVAVNNSYGADPGPFNPLDFTQCLIQDIVDAGIVMVFAASNDGGDGTADMTSPTCDHPMPGVICVASYDDGGTGSIDGTLSGFSSRGHKGHPETYPDIAAPGDSITSTCLQGDPTQALCYSEPALNEITPIENDWAPWYGRISGTSMASPHVTGIVGLMYQAKPDLTPADVERIIQRTARKVGDGYEADPDRAGDTENLEYPATTHFAFGAGLINMPAILEAMGVAGDGGYAAESEFVVISEDHDTGTGADVTAVSLQDMVLDDAPGVMHRLTVADAASVFGFDLDFRIERNVDGRHFVTIVHAGESAFDLAEENAANTAPATSVSFDADTGVISVFVPMANLAYPEIGAPIHNLTVVVDSPIGEVDRAPSPLVGAPPAGEFQTMFARPATITSYGPDGRIIPPPPPPPPPIDCPELGTSRQVAQFTGTAPATGFEVSHDFVLGTDCAGTLIVNLTWDLTVEDLDLAVAMPGNSGSSAAFDYGEVPPSEEFSTPEYGTGNYTATVIGFTSAGVSSYVLTVTEVSGGATTANTAPTANLAASETTVDAGDSVDFTVTMDDADGDALEYTLSFGDGSDDVTGTADGTVSHDFAAAGSYEVTLNVVETGTSPALSAPEQRVTITVNEVQDVDSDGDGILDKDEAEGCVDDPDPTCGDDGQTDNGTLASALSCALADAQNDPYTFDCTASSSYLEGGTVNAPQYKLVAGDGSQTDYQASGSFTHSYAAAGEYRAFVVSRDANGNSAISEEVVNEVVITINVTDDGANAARLKVDQATGPAPLTVTFDAGSSTVATGYHITGYAWDFDGDGSTDFQSSTPVAQHVYTKAGEYTPSVTVSYSNEAGDDTPTSVAKASVAATAPGTPTPPVQQSAGGGSLGWLVLLPLFGGALIRRRRG